MNTLQRNLALFERGGAPLGTVALCRTDSRTLRSNGVVVREEILEGPLVPAAGWGKSAVRQHLLDAEASAKEGAFAVHELHQVALKEKLVLRDATTDEEIEFAMVELRRGDVVSVTLPGVPAHHDGQ